MRLATLALLALCAAACAKSEYIDGFDPTPVEAGFTRYVTPIIPEIKAKQDVMWCQWIAAPSDKEMEVVEIKGQQSKYGHHVVLYATSSNAKVGTSRPCNDADMLSVRFVGGMGGEGASAIKLPEGYVYRIPKGMSLLANVHYINLGDEPIQGQAVVDVKLSEPTNKKPADIVTVIDTNLSVPVGRSSYDVRCTVKRDITTVMWSNHMHQYGTSVYSEVIHPDGKSDMLVAEDRWSPEEQFNPKFRDLSADPIVFHPGDVIHNHCEYNNTTGQELGFPTEMCVSVGFYVDAVNGMLACDGDWLPQ